jgi:two-component system chemotaxis sensor kinase CheA
VARSLQGERGALLAPAAAVPAASAGEPREDHLRIDPTKLDSLLASSSQLLIAGGRLGERPAELEALHGAAGELIGGLRRARRRLRRERGQPAARGLEQLLDPLDAQLQRLAQQAGRVAAGAAEDVRELGIVTAQVLEQVRRLRMRPLTEACEALPRAARDLAAAAGKEVQLELVEPGVEADRAVLEALREALLQLLRNAIDHGIESPAVRERLGKPRRGRVRVAAELRGDRLLVSVADDGAGLAEGSIRAQLAARGVPDPQGKQELGRALVEGGFSTRAEAGPISGRGVGLDIVRAAVDRIHGRVEVDWQEGRGTSFTIVCPPAPASIRALLVTVGPHIIALPTAEVAAVGRVRTDAIKRAGGRDLVATAVGPVTLVTLADLLGPPFTARPPNGHLPVVTLQSGERRLALVADTLMAEQEIVLRPIPGRRERLPLLSGAALLPRGQVALVLDPVAAVSAGLAAASGTALAGTGQRPADAKLGTILVVDDSITTRTLEQSILEAAGYDVATAVDGAEAWRWLQERACDLVVADVEMPRMDGFALCEAMRASSRLKQIPVVLVTALEGLEDRARGLEAGADAYLGKSSFDQQGLLDTVRQLIG